MQRSLPMTVASVSIASSMGLRAAFRGFQWKRLRLTLTPPPTASAKPFLTKASKARFMSLLSKGSSTLTSPSLARAAFRINLAQKRARR